MFIIAKYRYPRNNKKNGPLPHFPFLSSPIQRIKKSVRVFSLTPKNKSLISETYGPPVMSFPAQNGPIVFVVI